MTDETTPAGSEAAVDEKQAEPSTSTDVKQPVDWKTRLVGQVWLIVIALIIGAVGAQVIYLARDVVADPEELGAMPPYPPEVVAEANRVDIMNAAIGFGLAGALVCGVVGGALALPLRSSGRAIIAGGVGVVAGLVFGVIGGPLNQLAFWQVENAMLDDLFKTMVINAPFWIALGVALGLTVGLSVKEVSVAKVIGATIGAAIVVTLLFPLLAMVLFPASRMALLIPMDTSVRLLWLAFPAAVVTWGAARSLPLQVSQS